MTAVVIAAMMTGAAPVLTKFILRHLSVESVLIWRYLLALLAVAPIAFLRRPTTESKNATPHPRSAVPHISLAVVAIFGSGAGALLFTSSLLYAPAAVSNALSKAGPLLVAFLAYVWLQEPVSLGSLSMVAAMLLAAGLLGAGEFSRPAAVSAQPAVGVAMAVAAGLMRASAEVAAKAALGNWPPAAVATARFVGGVALAAGTAIVRRHPFAAPEGAPEWVALLVLALVCTGFPIWLYYAGMARLPVHHAAGLRTSGTAVTAVASWLVLGERLGTLHLLGLGALLFAAYAMAHMPAERPARRAPLLRLSGKLVSFVAAVVAVSILLTGALQAWQLHALLLGEVEASLSRAAALIGHIVTIQQGPGPGLRRYFDSLVHEQISGPGYQAEFSYIILTDEALVPLAWAFRRDDWPSGATAETARTLAAQGPAAAGRGDIVPVNVAIRTGEAKLSLHVGYRAQVAIGPLVALSLRTALLAGFLALVASAAAAGLVRGALAPIASASEELRRQEQATQRQFTEKAAQQPPAGRGLMQWQQIPEALPENAIIAAALLPAQISGNGPVADDWQRAALSQAAALDGLGLGTAGRWLLVAWGTTEAEVDDFLRAYAWSQTIDAEAVVLLTGSDWAGLEVFLAEAEDLVAETSSSGPWATETFAQTSQRRLRSKHIRSNLWLVEGDQE